MGTKVTVDDVHNLIDNTVSQSQLKSEINVISLKIEDF